MLSWGVRLLDGVMGTCAGLVLWINYVERRTMVVLELGVTDVPFMVQ